MAALKVGSWSRDNGPRGGAPPPQLHYSKDGSRIIEQSTNFPQVMRGQVYIHGPESVSVFGDEGNDCNQTGSDFDLLSKTKVCGSLRQSMDVQRIEAPG